MSTHAPAPWSEDPEGIVATTIEDANGTPICDVYGPDREATTRLIVAAPDLRTALQRLLACPDVNEDMLSPETIAACDQARAILNKS